MIPPELPISIYQGDTFGGGWYVDLPNLESLGGPADLTNATVSAQIRAKQDPTSEVYAEFAVEIVDAVARRVKPALTPAQTAAIPKKGYWDLQVEDLGTGWVGTVLRGEVALVKDVTRTA